MEQNEKNGSVRRRQLMKGAAWAAPSTIVATTAPTYAASPCQPYFKFVGGSAFNQGAVYADATGKTTNQSANFGGQTEVFNLPPNVTVESITYTFWIANRSGNDSPGPGLFWVGNKYVQSTTSCTAASGGVPETCDSPTTRAYTCTTSSCSGIPFSPTAGSGFNNTVSNENNLKSTEFPDGTTSKAWDLIMTWSRSTDKARDSRYSAGKGTCRNFNSGPSRRLRINYAGVPALSASELAKNGTYKAFVEVSITLSNKQVLSGKSDLLSVSTSRTNG